MTDYALIREQGPELLTPSEAVFDSSRTYRYRLTRTWNTEWPPVTWIMLNPSTADAFNEDPTTRRCIEFSRAIAAGGMIIVNLFAYRATQPSGLRRAGDPVGPLNDQHIREACKLGAAVIAAWGAHGVLAGRAEAVTRMLRTAGVQLSCLGTTRDGHPRHPLYVPGSTPLTPYVRVAGCEPRENGDHLWDGHRLAVSSTPAAQGLIDAGASDEIKRRVLGTLIGTLQGEDWDTEDESLEEFRDDPVIVALFAEHGVRLAEAEDE